MIFLYIGYPNWITGPIVGAGYTLGYLYIDAASRNKGKLI
jgi:hypothetical protein